jgi:hypothetical protein
MHCGNSSKLVLRRKATTFVTRPLPLLALLKVSVGIDRHASKLVAIERLAILARAHLLEKGGSFGFPHNDKGN